MTIAELIERLEDLREQVGDDCEVRLATQPNYPLEYAIGEVATPAPGVVYIGEEQCVGYLPSAAAEALGWK